MRRMNISFIAGLVLLTSAFPSFAELQWGKPNYIVVGKDAPQQEVFAANEFQRLYKLRTGEKLPIFNKEAGENGVFIGRGALNSERDERKGVLPDGSHYTSGTPIKWEAQLEKDFEVDFDKVSPDFTLYSLRGWTGTFAAFVVGGSPESTVTAVYDFCKVNLGITQNDDKKSMAGLAPFVGWSNSNFTQKPYSQFRPNKEAESARKKGVTKSKESVKAKSDSHK